MVNDAQLKSPPKSDVHGAIRTDNDVNIDRGVKILEYKGILWTCGLRQICLAALWLPLGALIFCYVTASMFQADDIHETHCKVYNVVPSISAITGISPQRYIWRICIAFHLGPRLLIGSLYYNYHKERNSFIGDEKVRVQANKLGEACYWLNLIELLALTGVTYVSNRENYFVHEKIFIVFMIVALLHMLCRGRVGAIGADSVTPVRTNNIVWTLFYVAVASTVGLVVFFLRHRLLCRPLAFTWFSVCEYILATTNMAFHAIVVRDLPLHHLQVVYPDHKRN
ncbi:post-GPI attachment to proteins factor 2-like isoform X1 [Bombyx mandarina]|uniref:CWH43-like N-terminal domain-containing protein n=2 Tax=Bombyx TaxID=7090 RepID=A0A8R2C6W1_BOMMO|nr:post-GPI attachment to proteins factor 2-like isoform X1 [Bombyx mori]XP_028043071.1 post-GPI attachment to proteins factor 2-like isoform X1 [Bombyx mandarina]